ncbi:unnamed protein product [Pieris macdunnoughi]|uniref:Uncharacterized protein n=1 Tax=Pieris macdunnoughi TaxID=345717 RepID=A0A821SPJ5_9NEOP|nr:unnamed protein product [Pieris macdunnoughi]
MFVKVFILFSACRLLESEITKYLETLEDSEDGLDLGLRSRGEGHYYQTARDVLRGLENSMKVRMPSLMKWMLSSSVLTTIKICQTLLFWKPEKQYPSRSQGISKRPLVWRKRNLLLLKTALFLGEKLRYGN